MQIQKTAQIKTLPLMHSLTLLPLKLDEDLLDVLFYEKWKRRYYLLQNLYA